MCMLVHVCNVCISICVLFVIRDIPDIEFLCWILHSKILFQNVFILSTICVHIIYCNIKTWSREKERRWKNCKHLYVKDMYILNDFPAHNIPSTHKYLNTCMYIREIYIFQMIVQLLTIFKQVVITTVSIFIAIIFCVTLGRILQVSLFINNK